MLQATAELNAAAAAGVTGGSQQQQPQSRQQSASMGGYGTAGGYGMTGSLPSGVLRPDGVIDIRVDASRGSQDGEGSHAGSTPSSIQVGLHISSAAEQRPSLPLLVQYYSCRFCGRQHAFQHPSEVGLNQHLLLQE